MATKMDSDLTIPLSQLGLTNHALPTGNSHVKHPKHSNINPMVSVFSKPAEQKLNKQTQLLRDILAQKTDFAVPSSDLATPTTPIPSPPKLSTPNLTTLSCSACDAAFVSREDMLGHYRDDWHRYNLRLQMAGKNPVREQEFSVLLSQDISSISGSDSSDDETLPKTPPRLMFYSPGEDTVCSVYRELVHHPGHAPASRKELLQLLSLVPEKSRCAVLMQSAGHFAGAIFHEESVICHKTFHRYVVRSKGGTIQSSHDKIDFARSVGAQMRRANEAALYKDIQELLRSWSDKLIRCDIIFLRIPFYSKQVFYAEGENFGFVKDDPRIRPVPVNTRRPTFTEAKRIHSLLTSLLVHGPLEELYSADEATDTCQTETSHLVVPSQELVGSVSQKFSSEEATSKKKQTKRPRRAKKNKKSMAMLSDPRFIFFQELMEACASGETPRVLSLLEELGEPLDFSTASSPPGDESLPLEEIKSSEDAVEVSGPEDDWVLVNDPLMDPLIEGSDSIDESPDEIQLSDEQIYTSCIELSQSDKAPLPSQLEGSAIPSISEDPVSSQPDQAPVSWKDLNREARMSVLQMKNPDGHTPLHLAASKGFSPLIFHFLRYGADPTLRDNMGKVAYEKAKDKSSRDAFRRFMFSHPNAYDYSQAKLTNPLSPEMEEELQKKRVDKKKKKAAKKQRKIQSKEKASHPQEDGVVGDRELGKREKHALAAEKRFMEVREEGAHVVKVCTQCEDEMEGSNYFEKSGYLYCSMSCLKEHRHEML